MIEFLLIRNRSLVLLWSKRDNSQVFPAAEDSDVSRQYFTGKSKENHVIEPAAYGDMAEIVSQVVVLATKAWDETIMTASFPTKTDN